MSLVIIKIVYNPPLSEYFSNWIKSKVTSSMISSDESTSQYFIEYIEEQMKEWESIDKRPTWVTSDLELLAECKEQNVEYIEI